MSGTVDRRGTSKGRKVAIVVFIFLAVGVVMDGAHHWHLLHQFLGH